tara:strand:- start:850 stop:1419 length:570 start_codon:yes stop_codon:yes gene_type:complete
MDNIRKFIENQIKNYEKTNFIEMHFGKKVNGEIFKTTFHDNNEIEFSKVIKKFRNYKLSYSQGKVYRYLDFKLKTFNNKYNEIHKENMLEKDIINLQNYDLLIMNNNIEIIQEFPLKKNFNEEVEYDEVNIHLCGDSNDQLLIFQKMGDYSILKIKLKIEPRFPYKLLDDLMVDIKKALDILDKNSFKY